MAGNRPARERFDFSLDARQVAGVTLGSLGALGLAFLLGHSTGQRMAERPAVASPSATPVSAPKPGNRLEELDHPPRPDGGEPPVRLRSQDDLVRPGPEQDRLPPGPKFQPGSKAQPTTAAAPPPGPSGPAVQGAVTAPAVAAAASTVRPVAAPASAPATVVAPPAAQVAPPVPVAAPTAPPATTVAKPAPARGGFVVQVGSTQERFEADRIALKYASRGARVAVADVPGKGRWYRVRLGSFETREAADRYLKEFERSTGAKGFVALNN